MQKIPSLFVRNFSGPQRVITQEVTPGCEWVLRGEGRPTRKVDGTACLVRDGCLYKRYDRKITKQARKRGGPWNKKDFKPAPDGFTPCEPEPDLVTGHWPGWLPVTGQDKWHVEAFDNGRPWADGTYELVGPKIQGNPYSMQRHALVLHGFDELDDVPNDFAGIRDYLNQHDIEGIVWHHHDGRMAKIKRRDFGFAWP